MNPFNDSSSDGFDDDYQGLFASSAFSNAPWNSATNPLGFASEIPDFNGQQLQGLLVNEAASTPGRTETPEIEIYHSKYLGDDLLRGPPRVQLTTFHDPNKQTQALFRWL